MQHGPHGHFDFPHDSTWCDSPLHTPRAAPLPSPDLSEHEFPAIHARALASLGMRCDDGAT